MEFFCWLGLAECGSHAANAAATVANAVPAAPEVSAGSPFLYAVTWIVGVLLVEQALLRRR
jgi:hypothetical protein